MKKLYLGSLALAALLFVTSCTPNIPVQGELLPATEPLPTAEQIQPVAAEQTAPPENYYIVSESYDQNGYHIRYPQIAGLTDSAQQDRINERIKDGALMGLHYYEYVMPEDEVSVEVDYRVSYSDLNLISIVYSGVGNVVGAAHPSNLFYASNLRMSTGESIRLTDFIEINEDVLNKLVNGAFQPVNKELSALHTEELGLFPAEEWGKRLMGADPEAEIGSEYSYFTEKSLGISLGVTHVGGDHAEYEIPYEDIWDNIKAKDDPAYATLLSSYKTSVPASASTPIAPQPDGAENQMLLINAMTLKEGAYWVDVAIQQPVTIDPAKFEAMRFNKEETIEINGQLYYFVDETTFRTLHPGITRAKDAVGVLYAVNEDSANSDIGPAFSVELIGGVYNVYYDTVGGTPYRKIGSQSYAIAPDAVLEVLTLGVSKAGMKYATVTPEAFYELFQNLEKEDPSGYYRSGFFGAGFLYEIKDEKIVRLHENYMP